MVFLAQAVKELKPKLITLGDFAHPMNRVFW